MLKEGKWRMEKKDGIFFDIYEIFWKFLIPFPDVVSTVIDIEQLQKFQFYNHILSFRVYKVSAFFSCRCLALLLQIYFGLLDKNFTDCYENRGL